MINIKTSVFNVERRVTSAIKSKKRAYWIKMICFVIAALSTAPAFAQIIIEGTIKDMDTKEGLPFSHVYIEGTSTVAVSDIDGVFAISVPLEEAEKKLVISSMGYNNFEQTPAEIQANQTKEFLLKSVVFDLDIAVVRSPEKILGDALSKLEENYWSEPFMVEGFYRKAALEDNKFAFLTEAIIQYHNKGFHKKDKESIDINFVHLRNSEDFRQIRVIQHWNPIYNALYRYDKIKTRAIAGALKKAKVGSATMELSVYNGENIYIINLNKMQIYVGFGNDRIYRVDSKESKNETGSSFQYRAYKGKLYPFYFRIKSFTKDGKKTKGHMVTHYKGRDIRAETIAEVKSSMTGPGRGNASYDKREHAIRKATQKRLTAKSKAVLGATNIDFIGFIQEFVATDITLKSEKKYKKKKTNLDVNKDLFETEIFYDVDFWNNFELPNKSKYLQKIQTDLEEAGNGKTLAQQFEETGIKNNEINKDNKEFRKRMKKEK